jgi:CDP-diacylglycerol--glycerol-3-phosphate 3-phosphatidyltransferase
MNQREIFTLSNVMSFTRIFLAAPIYYCIAIQENLFAIGFILLAMITDWLDGYFARKWQQITILGKVIDPLADKICTMAGFIALSVYQGLPLWITVVILGRDLIIMIASLIVIDQKKMVMVSNIPGKITVFFITLLGIIYLIPVESLKKPLILISAVLIIVSFINYAITFFKKFTEAYER